MSSKGFLDSLSKEKDTRKKEIKKEKKEKKEKEKKEKSKKRDSKNLEKDMVGDENQTEGNEQESSSVKTKRKFGIFRLRGMKSKGLKHGSSDSLTVQSRNSSGSEYSLQESNGSMESAAAETSKPSKKNVLDTEKESTIAKLKSDVWTGSPKQINAQSLETVSGSPQSAVILTETNQTTAKEHQKEGVKLTLEENVSSLAEEASHVVPQEASEDVKKVHGPEITSSDDEGVDTIVSTGISGTGNVTEEMKDKVEIGTINEGDVEGSIISTYKERKVPPQNDSQDGKVQNKSPMNVGAMLLVYPDKQQVQEQDDPVNEEIPVVLAVSQNQESAIPMLEEDASPSFGEETKHVVPSESADNKKVAYENVLSYENVSSYEKETSHVASHESPKNIKVQSLEIVSKSLQSSVPLAEPNQGRAKVEDIKNKHDREITRSEEKTASTVVSTTISNAGNVAGEMRDEVENGTLNKQRVHNQEGHRQDDRLRDEKPVLQAVSNNEKRQLLEKVDEFLKLNANIKVRSKYESENHAGIVKREVKEKMSSVIEEDNKLLQNALDIVDDPELAPKSSFFDEKTGFTSSTPKKNEEYKKMEPTKDNKTSSVMKLKLRAQLLNAIEDVKISPTVLMAQLAEVNKKLRELKEELLKLLENGKDEPKKASTGDVSI